MRTPRQHYADRNSPCGLTIALCGQLTPNATQDQDTVTCKVCLRRLAALPFAPSELTDTPWTPPPPKTAQPGQSELSPLARKVIADSIAGRHDRPTFGSMDKALELYAACCVDGYAGGSAAGSYEALGAMGTMIQTDGRGSSTTTRQAEEVAQVSKVLEHAFSTWEREHPYAEMGKREALAAYLLMRVGLPVLDKSKRNAGIREFRPKGGLRAWAPLKATAVHEASASRVSVKELGTLKKWANRRIDVEMVARGLVSQPRRPDTQDERRFAQYARRLRAVELRRAELGRVA